jgi:hypothetical protein
LVSVWSALKSPPKPKTIRGARTTVWATTAAARIAASQHLSNAWKPHAGLAICANGIRNTCLHLDLIPTLGKAAIRINAYAFRNSSGSLAMFDGDATRFVFTE